MDSIRARRAASRSQGRVADVAALLLEDAPVFTPDLAPREALRPFDGWYPVDWTAASGARVASYTAFWDCGDVYMEVA